MKNVQDRLNEVYLEYLDKILNDKEIREMCMIEHPSLPKNTFRFYHPDFLLRLGSGYRFKLIDEILKEVL